MKTTSTGSLWCSTLLFPLLLVAPPAVAFVSAASVTGSDTSSSNTNHHRATKVTQVNGIRRCLDDNKGGSVRRRQTAIMSATYKDSDTGCDTTSAAALADVLPKPTDKSKGDGAQPPFVRRDESAYILAGALTEQEAKALGIDPSLPRQSEDSPNPLLDPPRQLPNPYGWMRSDDRSSQEVLEHLKAENGYTEAITNHLTVKGGLRDTLYEELVGGMQETDYTTPARDGKFWYYRRTYEGKSYAVHCRAPFTGKDDPLRRGKTKHPDIAWDYTAASAKEDVILPDEKPYLDENTLAEGKDYCSTGSVTVSPSQEFVAYTVDYSGDETYELHIKNIDTDREVDFDEKLECDGTVVWGADDNTVFYLKMDDQHRPFQVYRRKIGKEGNEGEQQEDELLFEEKDDVFWVGISKSADEKYLFVETSSSETSEVHFVDLTKKDSKLECISKRTKKVLYEVEHRDGQFLFITNYSGEFEEDTDAEDDESDGGNEDSADGNGGKRMMVNKPTSNFRFMNFRAFPNLTPSMWFDMRDGFDKTMFDGGPERALDHILPFHRHIVAVGREDGIPRIWVIRFGEEECNLDTIDFTRLEFTESTYDVGLGRNLEYSATELVLSYDSLVTPLESILIDLDEPWDVENRVVLKQKNVPGYDRTKFACDRTTVLSRDGKTEIPLSLVYRTDVMEEFKSKGKTVPVHLYGYGSYGSTVEDDFSSSRLPLLNRGMVYAIAHVRGGGEMGRQWYEEPNGAKFKCKKNTFNDFVDVAAWLVEDKRLTTPAQMSCEGRSAGGLLIGASLNQRPDLFGAAILGVPFVDVVSTMIDASIPLTAGEWEEWGNPNEEKYLDYMMSYCPMRNVQLGGRYPSMLLTGGLHDPRVQYWEPSKFAATLRHTQGDDSGVVCLKIDMTAGHFSASDRYKYLKELAFDYSFLLDQLNLIEQKD